MKDTLLYQNGVYTTAILSYKVDVDMHSVDSFYATCAAYSTEDMLYYDTSYARSLTNQHCLIIAHVIKKGNAMSRTSVRYDHNALLSAPLQAS